MESVDEIPRHSVSVAGIVFQNYRVLTIQRADDGQWTPPGGILELDESITDAVVREVLEETGVHVFVNRLTGVYKNITRGIVTLGFECHAVSGEAQITEEAQQVEWLGVNEAMNRMTEAHAIRVKDAMGACTPPVRLHDGVHLIWKGNHGR
jgi:8-oxo-dGTP diphosphatase